MPNQARTIRHATSEQRAYRAKFTKPKSCTVCNDHGQARDEDGFLAPCRNCHCSDCGAQVGLLHLHNRLCPQCDFQDCASCGRSFPAAELHPMNDFCGDCFVPGYTPGMAAANAHRELRDLYAAVCASSGRPCRTLELAMVTARLVLDGKGR